MDRERFSPGVRPEAREERGRGLDMMASHEVQLAQDLRAAGLDDAAAFADLLAVASSTAEVRAANIPPEALDPGSNRRALRGEL